MNNTYFKKIKRIIIIAIIGVGIWYLMLSPILTFRNNENKLTAAAKRYFEINSDKLPTGERVKTLTLNELYKDAYLDSDFKVPYTGKVCSLEKSFVKVARKNGEYQYYTYLDCGILKSKIDHTGPDIKLKGNMEMIINIDDKYKEPGIKSVIDNEDGELKIDDVEIKGDVDTSKVGTYEVDYIAFDKLRNKSVFTRKVKVVKKLNVLVKRLLDGKKNFTGDPDNNYIYLSNMLFRIYGLDKDNNVILVSDQDISYVNYSKIDKWLDEVFYNHLTDSAKKLIVKKKYCNMTVKEEDIYNSNKCNSYTNKRFAYVPSVFDINNGSNGEANFMKSTLISWTANRSDDKKAYVTRNAFFYEYEGKDFIKYNINDNYGIRPMLTIKGDVIAKGKGSSDDPYLVDNHKSAKGGTALNKRYCGEYIKISNMVYRIMDVDDDGNTKVISNSSIMGNDDYLGYAFISNPDKLGYNPKSKGDLGYYINNSVSNYIDISYFVSHEINVPVYDKKIIYGGKKEDKKYNVKLSAPSMYDMFSARPYDLGTNTSRSYWLIDSSKKSGIHGAVYDIGVPVNEEILYEGFGIRVVGYIKKSVVISNGEGTIFSPYIIK